MALTWEQHQKNIFGGESGGDYDALFGYQNRPNGAFSNVKVSDMSLAQVLDFTNPRGAYGQYVAKNRPDPEMGVATPVGAYQVVGSTLRKAIDALGLDPNQKFDKATQDKIGQYILKTQGTGAWEGYGKGGASMDNKPAQMAQQQQPQQQSQGLLGGLLGGRGIGGALGLSDDMRDRLRMAILSGSDPRAFATQIAGAQQAIANRAEERRKQAGRNATADYLDSIGQGELAKLLRDGGINASTAFGAIPKADKSYQYQSLAADLLRTGVAKTEAEALQMALANTKAGTTVNVGPQGQAFGDPPKDMVWKRNPDSTVFIGEDGSPVAIPIAGTKLANEALEKDEQAEVAAEQAIVSGGVVIGNIQEIREVMENSVLPTTGVFGQILRNVGGTGALDVKKLLDPIEAAIGFERLQAMRDASPTGGALGQVTERELTLLSSALGSLDQAQSKEQFLARLQNIENRYTDIIRKFDAYPPDAMKKAGYQPRLSGSSASVATDDDLLKKYGGS